MERLEQRVRDSLQARATDVEPTPELWDEVGERIARRQRWRVTAWVLAGAAAAVVGILVVPGLLGGVVQPPEIEPMVPPTEAPGEDAVEEPVEPPVEDPAEEPLDEGVEGPDGADVPGITAETALLSEPVVAVFERAMVLLAPDGATSLVSLPVEGESRFLTVAVRPGSTVDDLTIVTTTAAEGFQDVRWTRVVDGEVVVAHEALEGPYAPAAASSDAATLSPVVWSPDGGSIAWFERPSMDEITTTLRTVGWDDGPGTGDTADDQAAFTLDAILPPGATPNDWYAIDPTRSQIRATMPDSNEGWYAIEVERQADGALALPGPAVQVWGVDEPALGTVGAVGGETDDAAPRWVVRLGFDGPFLSDLSMGTRTDLPGSLMPGDGFADLWLRPNGDGVIVGSRNTGTSYLVVDEEVQPLSERTHDLDAVR